MRLSMGIAGLMASVALASAADIPPPVRPGPVPPPVVAPRPVFTWTGCYIGINGGYGRGSISAAGNGIEITEDGFQGPLAGGQLGCNYQTGQFVWGVEADGQWSDIKKETLVLGLTATDRATWFATGRLRAGFAMDNVLFYGTGGYAHVGLESSLSNGAVTVRATDDRGGWTVGGGVEVAWQNWSFKAEYLYLRTFDETLAFPGVNVVFNDQAHIARIGLNYRFGPTTVTARY